MRLPANCGPSGMMVLGHLFRALMNDLTVALDRAFKTSFKADMLRLVCSRMETYLRDQQLVALCSIAAIRMLHYGGSNG